MAAKPVDRIRSLINDLERGARTLGDDIRKRAGGAGVTPDIDAALRQLVQGLSTMAAQLEKAAGELRRYLESSAKGGKAKAPRRKTAKKKSAAKKTAKKAAKKSPKKKAAKKPAAKKAAAKKKTAKKA